MMDILLNDLEGMKMEKNMFGGYECPIFVMSEAEDRRIHKPWSRDVIVKLLGRKIGYKAIETHLKQMWMKHGVINIIDLSNDYYLIAFTHEEDKRATMINGP